MVKSQTLEYYNWDDIEEFLSTVMGVEVEWNIWLEINNDIRNDSY